MPLSEDLERIALQERELVLDCFDESCAWAIGSHLRDLAIARQFPSLVIDIRRFGQSLFYTTVGVTVPDQAEWIRRKSNVVARFHRSSYAIGLEMRHKNSSLFERYGLPIADYAEHGGSFPLRVDNGGIIGSIAASGLPQREDHNFVVEGLCSFTGRNYTGLMLSPE
jgi:uncharacterized protein (UPF0303 family)